MSPRGGRQRKAWGESRFIGRNPRSEISKNFPAHGSGRQLDHFSHPREELICEQAPRYPSYRACTPFPSVTVNFRSTPGTVTVSLFPFGHLISSLSTAVAPPNPKCRVMSFCDA